MHFIYRLAADRTPYSPWQWSRSLAPRLSTRMSPSPSFIWYIILFHPLTFSTEYMVGGPCWQWATEEDEGGRGEVEGGHQHQHGSIVTGQRHISIGGREKRTWQSHSIQGFQIDQATAGVYWLVQSRPSMLSFDNPLDCFALIWSLITWCYYENPLP